MITFDINQHKEEGMKKEIPTINVNKTKYLKHWIAGKSYKEIGLAQKPSVSKQAMQQRVLKEISEVPGIDKLVESIKKVSVNSKGDKYPFLSFAGHPQGRLLAHLARHELGYSILAKVHCSLETIGQAQVKTKIIKATKGQNPIPLEKHIKDNPYAYETEFFLATEEPFRQYFEVGKVEGEDMIVALNADTILYTICSWMKNRPELTIPEILFYLTKKYTKNKGVGNVEDLKNEAVNKVRHIYSYDGSCKRRLLDFIGVHETNKS